MTVAADSNVAARPDSLESTLALLAELVRRPRRGEFRAPGPGVRTGLGLPMLWLEPGDASLAGVGERLRSAAVPCAHHAFPAGGSDPAPATSRVHGVLDAAARRLGILPGLLPFPRLELLKRMLSGSDGEPARPNATALLGELADIIPNTTAVAAVRMLGRLSASGVDLARRRGRWPWAQGSTWLRRRRVMPESSVLALTRAFGDAEFVRENDAVIARLLVEAFLADLAAAYRRRPWHRAGARRMAYPVLLLDGAAAGNGGHDLLRLIGQVRDQRGGFDPLLVVAQGADGPPTIAERPAGGEALRRWGAADRILVWRAAGPPAGPAEIVLHPVPWWWRRLPIVAVTVLALAAGGLTAANAYAAWTRQQQLHCGLKPGAPDAATLETDGVECIGVTARGFGFQQESRISTVEHAIGLLNEQAEAAHRTAPDRPYVTLAYIGMLSKHTSVTDSLTSRREALEGIAAAQLRQLNRHGKGDPIVRVLLGNAGENMHGGVTVAKILAGMAAHDPSIIGVVGLDQSREPTVDTIKQLTASGIPMVAATLSADPLPGYSRMYFQIAPNNSREAQVMAAHVAGRRPARRTNPAAWHLRVVRSGDPADTYSKDLAVHVHDTFTAFTADPDVVFKPDDAEVPNADSPEHAGSQVCGHRGVVVFVGRSEDFAAFLNGVDQSCGGAPDSIPYIIGGDDVSEHVADAAKRQGLPRVPFDFVSFAIGSKRCGAPADSSPKADNTTANLDADRQTLAQTFKDTFPGDTNPFQLSCEDDNHDPSLDGHGPLAYDAVLAFITAATRLRGDSTGSAGIPLNAGTIWGGLRQVRFDGASGSIDFTTGQVTSGKRLSVLAVAGGGTPTQLLQCPPATGKPDPHCP